MWLMLFFVIMKCNLFSLGAIFRLRLAVSTILMNQIYKNNQHLLHPMQTTFFIFIFSTYFQFFIHFSIHDNIERRKPSVMSVNNITNIECMLLRWFVSVLITWSRAQTYQFIFAKKFWLSIMSAYLYLQDKLWIYFEVHRRYLIFWTSILCTYPVSTKFEFH